VTDRVAVVIGGTSGVGREVAIGLGEADAHVVSTGRRLPMVNEVWRRFATPASERLRLAAMLSSRPEIDALRDAAVEEFDRVDILVNAAGVTVKRPPPDVSEEEWNRIMDVNLTGMLRACQSFFPFLSARKRGRIVNIASLAAFASLFEVAAYNSSKGRRSWR
jgi:NAD(P)-dependent dehydrogenase (short-subunit alcohol dehydrogenase family)